MPLKNRATSFWLHRFKKELKEDYGIIVRNDIHDLSLQNFIENRHEVNLSSLKYIDVNKRLHNWVLEQKELGDTISYQSLEDKTREFMHDTVELSKIKNKRDTRI